MLDIIVHTLSDSHAEALKAAKVDLINRNLAVTTLMLAADESVYALRDLSDSYWMARILKPKGSSSDCPEERKQARKQMLARQLRLETLKEAMFQIWGRTRVHHAIANSDLAPSEVESQPRTDKRACGKAAKALWMERLEMAKSFKFKALRDQIGWTNEDVVDTDAGRKAVPVSKHDIAIDESAHLEWLYKRMSTADAALEEVQA